MKFFVNEVNHVVVIGWRRVYKLGSSFLPIFPSRIKFLKENMNLACHQPLVLPNMWTTPPANKKVMTKLTTWNLRDKSFVSWLGLQFISVVMTGVAVGAGGSGAKSMYVSGTPMTTLPFWKFWNLIIKSRFHEGEGSHQLTIPISRLAMFFACCEVDELDAFFCSFDVAFDLCLVSSCEATDCWASLSVEFVALAEDGGISSRADKFLLLLLDRLLLFS